MLTSRRIAAGLISAGAMAGTALFMICPSALAQPAPPPSPPNCTAADLAGVAGGVAAGTSTYLWTHPDVNAFFSSIRGLPSDEVPAQLKIYFDAHPQAHAELSAIRQPLVDFRARCGMREDGPLDA